ncbi:hypothetical protein C770_GR4pB048 (plasmid) [Sinorhizobium meliloti GR4]|nr:hypothetical protein C770_GR4pB048 [Sinorhizobium meliloti GR4]
MILAGRDLLSSEVYQRLIEQLQLAPLEGATKFDFHFLLGSQVSVHARGKLPVGAAAVCFRPVKGNVGSLDQLIRGPAILRGKGKPDTYSDICMRSIEIIGCSNQIYDALCQANCFFLIVEVGPQDNELVASQPSNNVVLIGAGAQTFGHAT